MGPRISRWEEREDPTTLEVSMDIVTDRNSGVNPEERRWVIVRLDERYQPESFIVPEVASGLEDPLAQVTREEAVELCASLTAEFGTPHIFFYLDRDGNLRFPSGDVLVRLS